MYTYEDVMDYVEQEDVKFIRLAFCDIFGHQKNISIMPSELSRAFEYGVPFDASAIEGFGDEERSDLLLFPEAQTLELLPWRPSHGRVIRLYCSIKYPDGTPFEMDSRFILKKADAAARECGLDISFGAEYEFYLFNTDENGNPTETPHDNAGYMDIAPDDKGENVRREICLTLEQMGISPTFSHHQYGPGQHQVNFRSAGALTAADNAMTFMTVVRTMAQRNGLYASFDPKPLSGYSGSGFHINVSLGSDDRLEAFLSGILEHIRDMTAFLNPTRRSYDRLGAMKAPRFITWSRENRSQLLRLHTPQGESPAIELRSPDPAANPYIAFALMVYAGLDGIKRRLVLPEASDVNLYLAPEKREELRLLPTGPEKALRIARESEFISQALPGRVTDAYTDASV